MKVIICPIGDIEDQIFALLQEKLSSLFGCTVELARKITIPVAALDRKRRQYNAAAVLAHLQKFPLAQNEKVLGVIDVDLFTEYLNFIFGLADINSGICLISLGRLRQEFYGHTADEKLFHVRILKEAVHELGHILGLEHCPDIKCVMHFSNTLQDTDIKGMAFCPRCRPKLI